MARRVVVYTQPGCMFCSRVKDLLLELGVCFEEKDVARDDEAMRELLEKGFFSVPVTVVNGEAVIGYNRPRLEQLLAAEREKPKVETAP